MKRAPLLTLVALVVLGGLLVGLGFLRVGPLSDLAGPEPVAFSDLTPSKGYVRVSGMLHYALRVQVRLRAGALRLADEDVIVAPLFAPGDTSGREIRYLVLTPVIPDAILDFDERTVTGHLVKPSGKLVSDMVLDAYRRVGYTFAPDWAVLKEDRPDDYDSNAAKERVRAYRGLTTPKAPVRTPTGL
jgi:hypothetical protein